MNNSKNAYLLNCSVCSQRFSEANLPKILPCGKTLCQQCEQSLLKFERHETQQLQQPGNKFKCKLCTRDHSIPKINSFPTNEILLDFLLALSNHNKSILKSQAEPNLAMNLAMNALELNAARLDSAFAQLDQDMNLHFDKLKHKINSRTEQIVSELYKSRDEILGDLEVRKLTALSHAAKNQPKINAFQIECKKELPGLLKACDKAIDDFQMQKITDKAAEMNEQIVKILVYFEKCIDLKLVNSQLTVDSSMIGQLVNLSELASPNLSPVKTVSFTNESEMTKSNIATTKSKVIAYKLPVNTKNMDMLVLSNGCLLKVVEVPAKDEFNFEIKFQLINLRGDVVRKTCVSVNTYRMKRIRVNKQSTHVAILLVNNLLSRYQVKLFNSDLNQLNSLDLHFLPNDMFMNESAIYVQSSHTNSIIHKYNYSLDHVRSFGQTSEPGKPFFVGKHLRLIGIESEKLFFVDDSCLKVRILNEMNGKCVGEIGFSAKKSQFSIDASERKVFVLNERKGVVEVFSWGGQLLYESRIDGRIQSMDGFFVLNNEVIAVNDKRNRLVYIF